MSRTKRLLVAGGIGLLVATGPAACGGDGGDSEGAVEASDPRTPSPSAVAAEESAEPVLSAADATNLAQAAMLSPDSPLLDDYEPSSEPLSAKQEKYAPLYDCTQEEIADGRLAAYLQIFKGPWPKIEVAAHTYGRSSAEVLEQLRETWDSECTAFEETDSTTSPYRSERVETVAAPEGVDPTHWAADCAQVTTLDDGTDGIVFCSALLAVGQYVVLEVKLSGLLPEAEQYQDLLGAIASEVLAAQD